MATVKINAVDRSTGYTNSELEAISLRYTATDGEVGQGSVPVPNPAGTTEPYAGQSFQLLVGATLLFDGFIGPLQRERGETATGTRLVDTYTAGDENAVLSGFRAYKWVRPAETTKARFLAFLAAFVPWVTDTTWVTNDVVANMTAKTYTTETLFSDLFQEIKDLTGNTAFIENHRAHLHPQTVGITGGLAFSDTAYDYATTLPLYNPRRSKDPIDLRDDVKVVTPGGSYTATDSTAISRYDAGGLKHQALVILDSGTAAEAQTKAQAILADSKAERITYEFDTGPLTAAQLASIPVGCLVSVTSAVLGLSASTQRIAAMTVGYRVGDTFMAHIEMGFPVRIRKAAPRVGIVNPPTPSYAELEYPQATDPTGTAGPALLNWANTGDSNRSPRTPHPLVGLMAYDATGVDPSFPSDYTGLKMLGSGLVDIHCEAGFEFGYTSGSGKDVFLYVRKNGVVIGSGVKIDTGSGIHVIGGYIDVDLTGVAVAYGDIITAQLAWATTVAIGAIPIAGTNGSTYMSVTGDLVDTTAITSDTAGALSVPLEVVGILNTPIAGKTDGQGLVYDAASGQWIPGGGSIDLESAGVSVVTPVTVLNARHGLVADASGNLDVVESALDGTLIPGAGAGSAGRPGWDGEDGDDGDQGPPGPTGPDGRIAYQDHSGTGATETVSWSVDVHRLVLDTATVTLSVANVPPSGTPAIVRLLLVQDGTGGRAVTWWSGITWVGGTAPTLSTAAGAITAVDLQTVDGGSSYLGMVASGGSGSSSSASAAAAMPLADPYGDDATSSLVQEVADSFMLGRFQGLQVEDAAGNRFGQVERLIVDRASIAPGDGVTVRGLSSSTIGCKVYPTATQNALNSTFTAVAYGAETFDTDGFHDNVTNNTRITIPAGLAGKYLFLGLVNFSSANTNGERIVEIVKNGGATLGWTREKANTVSNHGQAVQGISDMAAGDYVEIQAYQNSGVTLAVSAEEPSTVDGRDYFIAIKLDSGKVGTGIGCALYHSTTVANTNATWTSQNFDSEEFDTDAFHDIVTNNSRVTIPAGMGGKYLVTATVQFNNTSGSCYVRLLKNGTTAINGSRVSMPVSSAGVDKPGLAIVVNLAAGDYIELQAQQNSGGSSTTGSATGDASNSLSIMRLDSLPSNNYGKGTAFPTGPATNDQYCRTDLGNTIYAFDGTRWLSTDLRTIVLTNIDALQPFAAAGDPLHGAVPGTPTSVYLVDLHISAIITGTNTGAAFWGWQLKYSDSTNAASNIGSGADTSADGAGTVDVRKTVSLNTVLNTAARWLRLGLIKTGAPSGSVYQTAIVTYRHIAT